MTSLDFIDDTTKAYAFVWRYRNYLFQNAIPVLFVKILFILIALVLNGGSMLRDGILMLPAHAIEGFFIILLVRFHIYGEPIHIWGKPVTLYTPPPIIATTATDRFRSLDLRAGIAIYILIKIFMNVFFGLMAINISPDYIPQSEPTLAKAIASLIFLSLLFWSLRLFWIYVPVGLGISMKLFLKGIHGLSHSLYFLGILFVGGVPLLMCYSFLANIIDMLLGAESVYALIFNIALQSFFILAILSVQAVAVSLGSCETLRNTEKL